MVRKGLPDGETDEHVAWVVRCLQVLSEWAHGMRISDEDVESERSVIDEERRGKQVGRHRVASTDVITASTQNECTHLLVVHHHHHHQTLS
jgi:hypothetical protein